jgi:hypothetical protein
MRADHRKATLTAAGNEGSITGRAGKEDIHQRTSSSGHATPEAILSTARVDSPAASAQFCTACFLSNAWPPSERC